MAAEGMENCLNGRKSDDEDTSDFVEENLEGHYWHKYYLVISVNFTAILPANKINVMCDCES